MSKAASTIDPEEIERFSRIAAEWWNPHGKFKPLHALNATRMEYIRDTILRRTASLHGLALLDIGCGGGLIAEPMARLGANVTGIDASEKNIHVAHTHAEEGSLTIDYCCTSAEALAESGAQFDVVLALEIIEHVADTDAFIAACLKLLKPGGLFIGSTLNRTPKSYALAIIGAEYILRWLPVGTHTWRKFLRPSEFAALLRNHGADVRELMGMVMHPLTFRWSLNEKDLSVNYLIAAVKL